MSSENPTKQNLASLTLAALGVVYGDLGTSPLYAMRESLLGITISPMHILGVLSLVFWTLMIVISIKYLIILLKADNEGEGGILALLALVKRAKKGHNTLFFMIAIFGAGFIIGDGMLTPAISVISAIEGIHVIFPALSDWVLPLTAVILIGLFSLQYLGTAKIGFVFGPMILLWFITLAALGLPHIWHTPLVLKAINPLYAIDFFKETGWTGYLLLGGIFLVATGAEALYADLGHFGKRPIRMGWFAVALPALLINYFGQGAFLLEHPEGINNPFYLLAPSWFFLPLLIIATLATIIASQAIISATFSLTRQAILQGLYPRLVIMQTSASERGQIYIPQMNFTLAIGTLLLIFTFKSGNGLAHAYGVAVNLNMVLTTLLTLVVAIHQWRWHWIWVVITFSCLCVVDFAFLGANLHKIVTGGWVPVVFALLCAFVMYTWQAGRKYLSKTYYMQQEQLNKILRQFSYRSIRRLSDVTAVFITDIYDKSGGSILHFLKLNRTLPEKMILLNYHTENIPYVNPKDRFEIHV
ncbi:MAG: KUP/HAK/KT family potassium transporter, partial [Methylococcales bacterium]|nr:KUP/HAK/KT family potassium transporter [Methylococcales bacterium]